MTEQAVRAAVPEDAGAICAIYNAAIAERSSTFETKSRSPADFEARIDDVRFPLLVSDGGQGVIGWAGLASYSTRPCYAGIGECSVYVAASARGHGVGTALTEALAAAAEQSGFHKVIGKLFADNLASVRLIERCDFHTVGVHRNHGRLDGAWRDVLVVERLLALSPPGLSVEDEPIQLAPPDPSWPTRFEQERVLLEEAIGEWISGGVHHVGSTAVPGMEAKPIIDILVGVESLRSSLVCFEPLAKLEYLYAPYLSKEMHWFCKPHPARRTHHLHLIPTDSKRYRDELAFRDRLRSAPEIAGRYAALKRELAVRHADDREAYTEGKGGFVAATLQGGAASGN